MAGEVSVDGHPASKAGAMVPSDAGISLKEGPRFVSRDRLEARLKAFYHSRQDFLQ